MDVPSGECQWRRSPCHIVVVLVVALLWFVVVAASLLLHVVVVVLHALSHYICHCCRCRCHLLLVNADIEGVDDKAVVNSNVVL